MVTATITMPDGTVKEMQFDSMDSALAYAEKHHDDFIGFSAKVAERGGRVWILRY